MHWNPFGKTLALLSALALLILIVPFALSFAQTVKQVEPAVVNKPVSWIFTLRASSPGEKGFHFPIPASAVNVTLKTAYGAAVQFAMRGGEIVCTACDLSKRDYVIRLETPAAALIEQGWVKNEAASTGKQEFWSQRETAFNPSEFNYKNVQGLLICDGDFVCSISSNGGNPFFKIDSLKSKEGVDFTVTAIKTKAPAVPSPVPSAKASPKPSPAPSPNASAAPIKSTPLIIPLEDYVAQTKAGNATAQPSVEPSAQASPAAPSPAAELPEIPTLAESDAMILLNGTSDYSFGLASVTGNDFPSNESAGVWSVFDSENGTAFELNFSFINSSGSDPQTLFFKTRFYNSSNAGKTRVEITFNESELCVSCFAWLKAKTFDSSLNELGEDDVFFNSESALSDSASVFLFKPIESNESDSMRKIAAEFDSSNSSFTRFFLTAYSVDGNYSGLMNFKLPTVTLKG